MAVEGWLLTGLIIYLPRLTVATDFVPFSQVGLRGPVLS